MYEEFLNLAKIHGPVYTFWMRDEPFVVISDLEIAKEAFVVKKNEISGRPKFNICMLDSQIQIQIQIENSFILCVFQLMHCLKTAQQTSPLLIMDQLGRA